jgi:hypothetical protein
MMDFAYSHQMIAQRSMQRRRKDGDAVLPPLGPSYANLVLVEIEILHSEPQPLQQPHSGSVEQRGLQPPHPAHRREQGGYL